MIQKEELNIGRRGEAAAEKYLRSLGYKILERNFCNSSGRRLGEIDLIAKDKKEIVFVEVKTSVQNKFSNLPEERINHQKLHKLNKIANFYLHSKKSHNQPYRFDAISVLARPNEKTASLKHLKNIFL